VARWAFAWRMVQERWHPERSRCPYCGSRFAQFLQRKWLLIQARKCVHCGLIYRWPTDAPAGTRDFYEQSYEGQQATDIPDADALSRLTEAGFRNTQYDKRGRAAFLERVVGNEGRFLDFGCSWGYSLFQYAQLGFAVTGFELDRQRARYGQERMGLDLRSDWDAFGQERFDVIFADHSLEHVPNPAEPLTKWRELAAEGAKLVVFVPNGSGRQARELGVKWGPLLGESHPIAFTIDWFARNLPRHGWLPRFYTPEGEPLRADDYLADQWEIALVATTD